MRINNNISAINTHRQYNINNSSIAKSTEKLSSGYRINRAGDDAAGLAISEKMRAQIRGLTMASKNSQDAISLIQTAEGALQESHNILQRMREIAVQSASDTNETTIDRGALEQEFQQLIKELDDTANKTRFNDQNLIDGTFQKTATSLAKAAGFANATNVHYTKDTAAATYTHTVNYTASSETVASAGVAPTATSTIGGSAVFDTFSLDLSAYTGSGAALDAAAASLVNVERGEGANDNQFRLTFEITTNGSTDTITFLLENNGTAALTIADETGFGAVLNITTSAAVASNEKLAEELDTIKTQGAATEIGTAKDDFSFLTSSLIKADYDSSTLDIPGTSLYNGTYTITAEEVGGKLKLSITDAMTGKVMEALTYDVAAVTTGATATDELEISLGQFGTIKLTALDDGPPLADVVKELNGKTITVTDGKDQVVIGNPASATVTTSTGETIKLTEGMESYTTKDGISINFNKALTKADFATQNDLMTAIYGGTTTTATITIGATEGKAMVIQTGANEGDNLAINIDKMDAWNLGVDLSSVSTREGASKAITEVNNAINQVSTQRAALGALQNRLDHKIANLDTSAENLTSAESRIRDIDMAKEMTNFTKNNILFQASTAMLAQANAMPQGVLQLLG